MKPVIVAAFAGNSERLGDSDRIAERQRAFREAYDAFEQKIPGLQKVLLDEFRRLLGD